MCNKINSLVICFLACAGLSHAKPAKTSKLSGFKGSYSGTIQVTVGASPAVATARATITAQKKKEQGTVSLQSVINVGSPLVWNEKYAISNRKVSYTLVSGPSFASGALTGKVATKTITYSGAFKLAGSMDTYFVRGTITKSGKDGRKLKITETITGPTTILITYNLTKRGK